MEIFPAIDLRDGKAVRLMQGDYGKMTVYSDEPADMAGRFKAAGARNIHIVDLDGAKDGTLSNYDTIKKILDCGGLFAEVGGGIRDEERIVRYLEAGVGRVILGTAAVKNPAFAAEMVKKYGDKIAVGVDARDGFVAVNGWCETTEVTSVEFCRKMADIGVATVIYTDISKDGAESGTNMEIYKVLSEICGLDIVASGGISFGSEIVRLRQMGIYGAIVGKAIYSGSLKLDEVIRLAEGGGVC